MINNLKLRKPVENPWKGQGCPSAGSQDERPVPFKVMRARKSCGTFHYTNIN